MSPLRKAPVTAECLIVCTALFVVCAVPTIEGLKLADVQRSWGAAISLQRFDNRDGRLAVRDPELTGPFDVWEGEWWRIPTSAFHHADAMHLLMNCLAAWILGKRLEQRWGSANYVLFLVPAIFVPLLAEFVIGHTAIGFSGAICAMLGAHLALRQIYDDDSLPEEAIQFGLAFIALGIPATMLDVVKVANVAHLTGLGYGWLATWAMCGPFRLAGAIRVLFVFAHLCLLPALWYATHPTGNGKYHWYMADHHPNLLKRQRELQVAVACDPSLSSVWLRLADRQLMERDLIGAWQVLIEGLSHNPSHRELFEATRRVWRRITPGVERMEAELELRRAFGSRADDWLALIRQTALAAVTLDDDEQPKSHVPPVDLRPLSLDQHIDLDWQPPAAGSEPPAPVDPNAPGSAGEGATS